MEFRAAAVCWPDLLSEGRWHVQTPSKTVHAACTSSDVVSACQQLSSRSKGQPAAAGASSKSDDGCRRQAHRGAHVRKHPVRGGLHVLCSARRVQVAQGVAAALAQHLQEAVPACDRHLHAPRSLDAQGQSHGMGPAASGRHASTNRRRMADDARRLRIQALTCLGAQGLPASGARIRALYLHARDWGSRARGGHRSELPAWSERTACPMCRA